MFRRSRRRERLLLPGETLGRRRFIQGGLLGAAFLAGAGWLAYRRTADPVAVGGPFAVLTPPEAGVLLAAARRIVPPGPNFPTADAVRIAERVDAFLAMSHPGVQKDVRQLLSLFDSALFGLVLDGSPTRFVTASAASQDARLASWATSRLTIRRTGFRAIRRLVCSAYYSSPQTWGAIGYPGPPALGAGGGGG